MKKNIYKILLASLLTLTVGSCAGNGEVTTDTSTTPEHVHHYDEHGFCPDDGFYGGESKNANDADPLVFENVTAETPYFARVLGLDKTKTFQLDYLFSQDDNEAKFKAWGRSDDNNFVEVNLFNPTGAIGYSNIYMSLTPSYSGYNVAFDLKDTTVDKLGYRSDGVFTGTTLTIGTLRKNLEISGWNTYFRVEVSKDDLYNFTCGDGEIHSRFFFYTRTTEGEATRIDETVGIPFVMPEAPDGYLYAVAKTFLKYTLQCIGLVDMNSDMGHVDGIFFGHMLELGLSNQIPALRTDQRHFFKFYTHKSHSYGFSNLTEYSPHDISWYGHDGDNYDRFSDFQKIDIDDEGKYEGKLYDYFVVVFTPSANRLEDLIQYDITHGESCCDEVHNCECGIYAGETIEVGQSFNYMLEPHEKYFVRIPITNGRFYKLNFGMWFGLYTVLFKVKTGENTFESISWELKEGLSESIPTSLTSLDSYLYLCFDGKEEGDVIYVVINYAE